MNKNVIIKTKKFYFVGNRGVNSICLKLTIEILQYRLENKGVKLKREKRDYLSILIAGIFMLLSSIGVLASPNFTIKSDSAILMDAETGQVLFEKNMNKIEYPASITKVMTGLLALENSNLDDIITMTHEGVFSVERDSSHIALNVGEQISMRDALYALAIQSANDAANGIGIHISGSLEEFAKLMNKRAKELGALNTHFVTTNGLHDSQHYTTAYDMALFMKQAIQTPYFMDFFNQKSHDIPPTNMQNDIRYLHNKNGLLNGKRYYYGLIASKTGWTTQAKHTLVTVAKRGSRILIVVALNSEDASAKYEDTMNLFDYGFNEFKELSIDNESLLELLPKDDSSKIIKKLIKDTNPYIIRLLHKNLSEKDIKLNHKTIENSKEMELSLSVNDNEFMYSDIGVIDLMEKSDVPREKVEIPLTTKVLKITKQIFMYLFLFLVGLSIFRKTQRRYLKYKNRNKKL